MCLQGQYWSAVHAPHTAAHAHVVQEGRGVFAPLLWRLVGHHYTLPACVWVLLVHDMSVTLHHDQVTGRGGAVTVFEGPLVMWASPHHLRHVLRLLVEGRGPHHGARRGQLTPMCTGHVLARWQYSFRGGEKVEVTDLAKLDWGKRSWKAWTPG